VFVKWFRTLIVTVLAGKGICAMDYLLYSSDFAPADFWLFPKFKESAAERKAFLRH
jgi:hypothetical protein